MKKECGFTLLEMMVAMLIVSGIVLAVYTAYSTVVRTWETSQEQSAWFRLEAVTARLLGEDWKALVPYGFTDARGAHDFFVGRSDRLAYVTSHGLGARRSVRGGLFFTLLLLEPLDQGLGLFCYKTDVPDLDLSTLVRLYHAGGQDAAVRTLELSLLEKSRLLKTVDTAAFSFDSVAGNATVWAEEDAANTLRELELLAQARWTSPELPRRLRLSWQQDEDVEFLEITRPVEAEIPKEPEEQPDPVLEEDLPWPDLEARP